MRWMPQMVSMERKNRVTIHTKGGLVGRCNCQVLTLDEAKRIASNIAKL
jgi:hypothetical protein